MGAEQKWDELSTDRDAIKSGVLHAVENADRSLLFQRVLSCILVDALQSPRNSCIGRSRCGFPCRFFVSRPKKVFLFSILLFAFPELLLRLGPGSFFIFQLVENCFCPLLHSLARSRPRSIRGTALDRALGWRASARISCILIGHMSFHFWSR